MIHAFLELLKNEGEKTFPGVAQNADIINLIRLIYTARSIIKFYKIGILNFYLLSNFNLSKIEENVLNFLSYGAIHKFLVTKQMGE